MSVAICLLVYSLVVMVLAPPTLIRTTRCGVGPRLSLIAWLSAIGSVVLAWVAAIGFVIGDVVRDMLADQHLNLSRCFDQLHDAAIGEYGTAVQVGLLVLVTCGVAAGVVLIGGVGRALVRARSVTHGHARAARIVGRPHAGHDAVVIDHPEPAAYSVAGDPHTIVLTQGIVAALDEEHLAAVLAHERAHLAGKHHLLLAVTRALAGAFPRIDLFTVGAAQVARLVEMSADDVAAASHGRETVREALLTLADSNGAGTLGATEVGLADRVARLASPAPVGRSMVGIVSALIIATILAGPMIATLVAVIGLGVCHPD
ncbi:M56 family metallopeptidase [Nocardia salmonicida]|uniref:M56 family metallopeptidase n=1 Tax=Nocardia salmonicida TaxID=53431 RepID=UPI0007A3FC7A|nr:M56 family metallopeptidase [Nocardia salmonicida]